MNLRPRRRRAPEVNLTPLIDVVFLLLIFFMVSTTFEKNSEIQIKLPEASAEASVEVEEEVLLISIDKEGRFYVNQKAVDTTDSKALMDAIEVATKANRDLPVVIDADARTPHQAVISAMDAASRLGHVKMSFSTVQPAAE